ncbi:MAG TPA: PHP domain-containing protein, partial [Desulfosalsimonadaceae bacterium]|nr:PHP domain-containing protein [Desulfosalsimonadaceae bacterium]
MIPLTVRSAYSLMWGVSGIKPLCRHAKKMGYNRLALTDTDNLYGLWSFLAACRNEGVRPIIGAEVTDKNTSARAICLVKNNRGYSQLCRLLTRRHTRADFELKTALKQFSEDLVVLTTSPDLLCAGHDAGIDIAAALPRKPLPAAHPMRETARRLGLPVVATPGSYFNHPDDFAIHRVLRAIDKKTALSRLKAGDTAPPEAFLAAPETYRERFAACPEAVKNTAVIAERLAFTGPDFGLVMPPYEFGPPARADAHLRDAAYEGARRRYGEISDAVADRLEYELRIISDMGFSGYFLIVSDIVSHSPRTCGRGSGAASLVAYCLGITNVCPVKHNLYFERFLNPGRTDPPDIDVDFAWDERDDVISGVLSKYSGRAALVANHVCFKPRMAVRETARVFGLTDREINRIAKRLPWFWKSDEDQSLQERMAALPQMQGIDFPEPWPEILAIAQRLIGLPRYLSVHPGGVVITPKRIDSYVAIQTATKGVPIVQWEKDAVEDAGLVKIDLLGNRSLGVIRDALADMCENGIELDESRWEPEDDYATQEALARGGTMGCFYIESPAMRILQQKSRVGDFEHLV